MSFRSFDQRGSTSVIVAIVFPVLLGMLVLVVDVAELFYSKARLQTAADSASLAAAMVLPDTTAAKKRAVRIAAENVPATFASVTTESDVRFGIWNASLKQFIESPININAVQVSARRGPSHRNEVKFAFASMFGFPTGSVSASAIAVFSAPEYCVISLEDGIVASTYSAGASGRLTVKNCGVYVNSRSNNAATTATSASSKAAHFCIVGGYSGTFSPTPKIGCPPIADPLAHLPEPAMPAICLPLSVTTGTVTLNPGCYSGISITGSATVSMNPGMYYIKGGTLALRDSGSITGHGVTLFLDASSSMNAGSKGRITLSAPTSGTYRGILFFQSRAAPKNIDNRFGGTSTLDLGGTMYFPTINLTANGTTNVSDVHKAGYVIARSFAFTGDSELTIEMSPLYLNKSGGLALVE